MPSRKPQHDAQSASEVSVARYPFVYVVIAIFIFLAMGGYLPTSGTRSSSLVATASSSDTIVGQLFQGVMWGLACVLMSRCWRQILETCKEMKALVAVSLLAPVSALWSQQPANSIRRGTFQLLGVLFAFYLIRRFSAKDFAQILLLVGVTAGILGILVSVGLPQYGRDTFNGNAWQGIFRSKNGCSEVMLFLTTPIITFRFRSLSLRILRHLLFMITGVLLIMANAKTAWILAPAYVLLLTALASLRKVNTRDRMLLLLGGTIGLVSIILSFSYILPLALGALGKDPNISGRLPLWASVIQSILKRPLLGYGYAAFWTGLQGESLNIYMATHFEIYQAQNGVLEIWLELGIAGVFLLIISFVSAINDAVTCFKHGQSQAVEWYVGLFALTIAYNIDETFLVSAHSIPWLLYVVACTGLAAEAKAHRRSGRRQRFHATFTPTLPSGALA
jgi:exopolysaccharide production protein ExoQ